LFYIKKTELKIGTSQKRDEPEKKIESIQKENVNERITKNIIEECL
jgi:hypothetical protein